MSSTYVFDQRWQQERNRLTQMEDLFDSGTRSVIESLGIAPGWRCLEVGAGAGSIAGWLADRVGPEGHVLATDVSTEYMDWLDKPNLDVRRHDILSDPLPVADFDLVHARLLVEHLGPEALEHMLPPIRPGGWLVVESMDVPLNAVWPDDAPTEHAIAGLGEFMAAAGFDNRHGRKLIHKLELAGLEEITAEGRMRIGHGGSPASAFLRLTLESLRPALLGSGDVPAEVLDHAIAVLNDPGTVFVPPPMIAARGRKPDGPIAWVEEAA
jgi:SAM-dependent methyltransferase